MPPDEAPKISTQTSMPAQPPTTKLEALTDRKLLEMLVGSVKDTNTKIDQVNDKVDTLSMNVEILQEDGKDTKQRIIRIETWKDNVNERLNSNSQRARATSQVDLTHDAAIAKIVTEVDGLKASQADLTKTQAAQTALITAVHDSVTGFFNNKKVQFVGKLLFGLAMTYAAAKGIRVLP